MIQFTQGDDAVLNFTAQDGEGNPITLTGAVFTTQILGPGGVIAVFPNSQHTANPDQVNFQGQFTLALSTTDTASCNVGLNKQIITKIVISGQTIFYRGVNILTVYPPVPIQ